jgi:transaldolase/glucose-6-phosphate isomerase
MAASNPTVEVQAYGQSLWYDNISRALLKKGEIKRLIEQDGVMGITSNPTIFMKAIGQSDIYDEAIQGMLDLDPYEVYEALAVEDIRAAADLLLPIYEKTEKVDGYISLEVSPLIADDTEKTLSEAKRLFELVARPNVMIKIPGTSAGLPAVEHAIAAGININITLIFSVENYRSVVEAYLRGLERRVAQGLPIDSIASVASFFVSRIDSRVDQQLQNNIRSFQGHQLDRVQANRELLGKVAIANAKMAYRAFQELFGGERFRKLAAEGARVQRPLWASTGTKNPAYFDTLYVDSLIGPHTVNTLPPETLKAFKDHGSVAATLETDFEAALETMRRLAEVGVDLAEVNHFLQQDGVDAFSDSFEKLLQAVQGKQDMLRAGVIQRQSGIFGGYEPGIRRAIAQAEEARVNQRIWAKDAPLWKDSAQHQESIRNRLGWLFCLRDGRIDRARLVALKQEAPKWSHVVLLGMGGSSLAPEVLRLSFGQQAGYPDLLVLDTTDPGRVKDVEQAVKLDTTVFIVASKSGSTIETECFRSYFYELLLAKKGAAAAGQHFIAITDEGSDLARMAEQHGYAHIFINPSDIGGRYSALSYFGLVPAALLGLDLDRFLASAEDMLAAIGPTIPAQGHPGVWLGVLMGYLAKKGHDKLGLLMSEKISSLGNWIEQLVAESTGKEGKGVLPVVPASIGKPHDYDDDRFLVYIRLEGESPETDQAVQALWEAGHPVFTLNLRDEYDLAGEFLRWEYATAVAGQVLAVNPFDEPNVTESKKNTSDLLTYYQKHGHFPQQTPFLSEGQLELYVDENMGEILARICAQRNYRDTDLAGLLAAHISFARSGSYIALMAYLNPTSENQALFHNIQRRLRHLTTRAVTLGYGPRFLHSTGQFHKGGPANGVFIQISVEDPLDLAIPGRPYSFSILKQAQAMGDQKALMGRDLPFVRLHIKGDVKQGLQKILEAVAVGQEKQI